MKLSIITINRDNAAGLRATLESTFSAQKGFGDWEQIVVDGASTDGSFAEVDRYRDDPRLGWCVSEPDQGIYNAMNKGAAHARGDYLLFLNSGDTLLPDVLERAFSRFPESDIVYGELRVKSKTSESLYAYPPPEEIVPSFFLFCSLPHQATFISRSLLSRLGGYDESFRIVSDAKFFLDAVRTGAKLSRLEFPISRFLLGGMSSSPETEDRHRRERERFLSDAFGRYVAGKASKTTEARPWIREGTALAAERDPALAAALLRLSDLGGLLWTSIRGHQTLRNLFETLEASRKEESTARPPSAVKLSIVTINRNDAAGLARTLKSTFEDQRGFDDWEQIVVDGASTDGSFSEIDRYRDNPHLGWSVSEPDEGIYNAMNKGAAHARGDYLLFLNAGDVLKPGVLAKVFRDDPSEDILYGDVDISTKGVAKPRVSPELSELTPGWFLFDSLPHQGCFIRRDLHEAIGGYDETYRISAAPAFVFRAVFDKNATLRRLPLRVSEFDRSGVSSQPRFFDAKMKEWERFLVPYFGKRVVSTAQRGLCNQMIVRPAVTALVRKDWSLGNKILALTDWFAGQDERQRPTVAIVRQSADWASRQTGARGISFGELKRGAEFFLDLRNTRKGRLLLRLVGAICGRRVL